MSSIPNIFKYFKTMSDDEFRDFSSNADFFDVYKVNLDNNLNLELWLRKSIWCVKDNTNCIVELILSTTSETVTINLYYLGMETHLKKPRKLFTNIIDRFEECVKTNCKTL